MENIRLEELFELYREVCKEVRIEWSIDGWNFFKEVMFPDYINYCKHNSATPSRTAFKRNCIYIALDMIKEVK